MAKNQLALETVNYLTTWISRTNYHGRSPYDGARKLGAIFRDLEASEVQSWRDTFVALCLEENNTDCALALAFARDREGVDLLLRLIDQGRLDPDLAVHFLLVCLGELKYGDAVPVAKGVLERGWGTPGLRAALDEFEAHPRDS